MKKALIKNILFLIIFGLVYLGVGDLLAYFISNKIQYNFRDVMFFIGLGVIIIGVLSMISGNPSGINLSALGQNNAQYIANANFEVTKMEREITNYYTSPKNRINIKACFSSISIILGGLFMVINSFLL